MAYVLTQPQVMASAAAQVAAVGTAVRDAGAAAARTTTGLVSAAADEVSNAIAGLFNAFAEEGQQVISRMAAMHQQFAQSLAAAGEAYTVSEAASVSALTTPLLGGSGTGGLVTLVMDGSGTPIPPADFVANVVAKYLEPHFPVGLVQALALPAGEFPDSGIKDLTSDVAIARGVTILNNAIQQQLAAGNALNIVAYSQSANIASLEMQLLDPTGTPSSLPINFVLLGNSMNPNGGWDARFPGLSLPSLGITTLGPAPSNSFPTLSYTLEYDGWADFPRYPINVISDLNALAGMVTVHTTYDSVTAAQLASAIVLPTQGPTTTTYYMIPTQNLPLLDPIRAIPFIGNPLADLVQPALKPIVNWGYGDPNFGYSTGPANVPTPFGFLPPLSATAALGPAILQGIPQGIAAAAADLAQDLSKMGPLQLPSLSLADLLPATGGVTLPAGAPSVSDLLLGLEAANTAVVGSATNAFATAYATLLPTADLATAALVSLPSYDANLFLDGVLQAVNGQPLQGLVDAFGNPIAANVGLLTLTGGLELTVLVESAETILTGTPFPSP
ncbi:PE family protein [Mycobacterium asiaticum]|uniref:PE family protein n=1 Tax=Mycobacterium asiaticum TaxID=1790 RepID=UPI0007EFB0E7|nr:PE-PPE domain-containing protein [Mycobacterium asiaticum]OBJ67277.1 hypothetical protein A9W94_00020 [Mycobacterium asiaticum]